MIWDFVVVYVLLTFAVAGWNIGLLNSWRAPVAMLAATFITQVCYLDFSAWLQGETHLPGDSAVFLGYVLLWLSFTIAGEGILFFLVPFDRFRTISKPDKWGGAILGLAKGGLLLCFATLASVCAVDFPNPPHYPEIARWVQETSGESNLLDHLRRVAIRLPDPVVASVVAVNGPSFRPVYNRVTVSAADIERTRKVKQLFNALRDLQREVDGM